MVITVASESSRHFFFHLTRASSKRSRHELAREEISNLEKKGSWVVLRRASVKCNILLSMWALKRKRYPDSKIRKYKA